MTRSRHIRKEASALLAVAKSAFKFIRDNPSGDPTERAAVLEELACVIERADPSPFDESLLQAKLAMTNPTADAILVTLQQRSDLSAADADLLDRVENGLRRTKKRAYISLDIEVDVLRRLRYVLLHTQTDHQAGSFKRLAEKIEEEVANKNPMKILGEMAL